MDPTLQALIGRLDRLSAEFEELRRGVLQAVHIADEDPEMALIRARKVLEFIIRDVFVRRVQEPPGTRPLENLIQRLVKDGHLPAKFEAYTETIRKLGNVGAHHFGQTISADDVYRSLAQLMPVLEWYFEVERPEAGLNLERPNTPRSTRTEPRAEDGGRSSTHHVAVVPKGLRSFDANDSGFYLQLLPGPRDKDGLPESIRFWKHRIEDSDDLTFTVGVIYGPSGCGKSSLAKAGLLPRLARRVIMVYVEATPEETEIRILNGFKRRIAGFPRDLDLRQSITALRQGQGLRADQKVVIVLDQFEQWLHAHRTEQDTELARALRQCDGDHVQCILLVRDDFWVSLTRFMGDLGIEIVQGQNTALVDLFDPIHARRVLSEFGRSYGRIPALPEMPSRDQDAFLDAALTGLSQEGRVSPVRLALFAEMVKGKPWVPATLREVGGADGVGISFLDETFNSVALHPHRTAAQAVLAALLPESGSDIKGRMRSHEELSDAAGYVEKPKEFNDLLRTLDGDVRLITPTDPEGQGASDGLPTGTSGMYYQLTHDSLVPSLREWLTRKQKQTRRGRAELRLVERSALWNTRREYRYLPSIWEWANIRLLTRARDWTETQQKMMRKAGRMYGLWGLATLLLLLGGTVTGLAIRRRVIEEQEATYAMGLVERLLVAETAQVPTIIPAMRGHRRWIDSELRQRYREASEDSSSKLHASLALLPVDPAQVEYLSNRMLSANPTELRVLRDALKPHQSDLVFQLWSVVDAARPDDRRLLPATSALALYDPGNQRWAAVGGKVAQALVSVNPVFLGPWLDALRPVHGKLTVPLATVFRDRDRSESERTQATSILADYASDDPGLLADLLMDAEPKSFASFFPVVERYGSRSIPVFQAEIQKKASTAKNETNPEPVKDRLAERQARAAVALVRMGKAEEVWPLLRHSADPRLRSFIVNWLDPLGADPKSILAGLNGIDQNARPTAVPDQQKMDAILFHPETSMRRALILALGTPGTERLSAEDREALSVKLLDVYRNDPDAGIHGAAEWTLRQWTQQEKLRTVDTELMTLKDRGDRRWYVNSERQTFVVIDGPVEFSMGSPPTEPDHLSSETLHRRRINRSYALAAREVTMEQYRRFRELEVDRYSPDPDGPANGPSWYDAAAYCNWLSEREGLDRGQWCYEPNPEGEYAEGMKIVPDVLTRSGYRLPTEAEWEYACRAGAVTSRYHGESAELLGQYAWYNQNSRDRAWPCGRIKPNDLGLFDMLGNVYEWCQDRYGNYPAGEKNVSNDDINHSLIVNEKDPRLLRGGTFLNGSAGVRSAGRYWNAPAYRSTNFGFRPSRTYH